MFHLADLVQMKKPHACGQNEWEILRLGADIRLKCMGCGHLIMMPHLVFNKKVKKRLALASDPKNTQSAEYVPKERIAVPEFNQEKE